MQSRSVHDNQIIGYDVDSENRRIVLHTRYDDRTPIEYTDVVFDGVLAYQFENDNFGNIILGIEEVSLSQLLAENADAFERGKNYAWPGVWNESLDSSLSHFESKRAKAFEISSSFGMGGWVVAESCRFEEVLGRATSSTPLQPVVEKTGD